MHPSRLQDLTVESKTVSETEMERIAKSKCRPSARLCGDFVGVGPIDCANVLAHFSAFLSTAPES